MNGKILAIDPGNVESGYAVVEYDKNRITRVLDKGKVTNLEIYKLIDRHCDGVLTVEMIQSLGMAVGQTVFDTCVWIGRFIEYATARGMTWEYIFRKEEKQIVCGNLRAKDANIRQALIDLYAPNTPNCGKGYKEKPGFFYGFAADAWMAFCVAHCYFEKYVKGSVK